MLLFRFVGGFGVCGAPDNLIDGLLDVKVNDLTIVSNNCGIENVGLGKLLFTNQIKRMVSSYVGENKEFAKQYLEGELEVEFIPQGTLAEKIRTGGAGIPAFYTPTGVNSFAELGDFPIKYSKDGVPEIKSTPKETRIFNGRKFLLETSIRGDYALIKAKRADSRGNVQFNLTANNFNVDMAKACDITIVEVEEIVEAGEIPPDQVHLPSIYVDRIVKCKPSGQIEKRVFRDDLENEVITNQEDLNRHLIARRAAFEFKDGMYCNLGIGMPTLSTNYVPKGLEINLQSENGILGIGPYPVCGEENPDLINAGKETITAIRGSAIFSSSESFSMIRGGHLDLTILGSMQVSQFGDIANWIVPSKRVTGPGGAMDLVSSGSKVVVTMSHTNKQGEPKIVQNCTLPLTGKECISRIITELAVFDIDKSKGLILIEIAPGVTVEEVKSKTEASFEVSPNLKLITYAGDSL